MELPHPKLRICFSPATSRMENRFDAASLLRGILSPPLIALQGHFGKCLTAAQRILMHSSPPSLGGSLLSWSPTQIRDRCSSFITDAGRKLEIDDVLARIANHVLSINEFKKSSYACLSVGNNQIDSPSKTSHLFDIALSTGQVSQKLDGIPVYTVCNAASEFVLVSDSNNRKSLGIFCFRRNDAEALLQQVKEREPAVARGAKVVAVSLNKIYKLTAEGISFRFLPDPGQVKNALEATSGQEDQRRSFEGVPIFQSDNLIVRSKDMRFCPIFFCKEDLDQALQRALKQQQMVNPSLRVNTDIQVGSFENVLKRMEDPESGLEWGDVVFIPPGMMSLSHLGEPSYPESKESSIG